MNKDRLKYRVWYNSSLNGVNPEEPIVIEPRYFYDVEEIYDGNIDGLAWVSCFGDLVNNWLGEFTLEQCTGLKDKNGKLIYEGDVFEATVLNSYDGDDMLGKRIRGQVAYFEDGACFTFAAYTPSNLCQIEVIGNIHEME